MTTSTPPGSSAADRARHQLLAWPGGEPVRLAKRTSNLFRGRQASAHALDLSEFDRVESVDPASRTARVGGLTTYEDLVAATLPHALVPLVVPQLRTITLVGAVTGLGIEASSFRNGLPHESVLGMDILVGTGEIVRAAPRGPHADLFFGFPNSYGSLGYALTLDIELEPARRYVAVRHLPCGSIARASALLGELASTGVLDDHRIDFLDATMFSPTQVVVTVGRFTDDPGGRAPSDYTGQDVYYRSLQRRRSDLLTTHDYLWRWDTDWFWCSRAFGVQQPLVRRLWPDRYKRSDLYWKLVAADRRHGLSRRITRARRRPPREPVVQDVEVPIAGLPQFLEFLHRDVGVAPVWLCPLRARDPARRWPLSAFDPGQLYVNVGFWSSVPRPDGDPADGRVNRAVEAEVDRLGGRKSLYSTSYYSRDEFAARYGGDAYLKLKSRYDPDRRFADLYDKCVRSA